MASHLASRVIAQFRDRLLRFHGPRGVVRWSTVGGSIVASNVASIKIPPLTSEADARARIDAVRRHLPAHVNIGISGDPFAATALIAGCEAL